MSEIIGYEELDLLAPCKPLPGPAAQIIFPMHLHSLHAGGLQAATVLTGGVALLGAAALLAALAAAGSGGSRRRGKRSVAEKVRCNIFEFYTHCNTNL